MSFANPAGLALLVLAIPIVLLHVLKPRRSPVAVSSTWLWQELSRPVTAAAPWQRLRPSLLLFLQLLAVALLALAAARPVRSTDAPLAPHTVFILDASGSMAAVDGSPERLDEAKAAARDLRSQLPVGGVASIVIADHDPHVALSASPDSRAFADALRPVQTVAAPADMATAFTLAASLETPGLPIGFVLISDGRLGVEDRDALIPGTRYVRVGDRATNRAITRLVVDPEGAGLRALVVVRNAGGATATDTLRLDVDGITRASLRVRVPAGETVERSVSLPDGDRVEAFLEGDDLVAADDHAFAVAARRPPVRVLHAGPENPFLDHLLSALPGVTVERAAGAASAGGYDLAILDRVAVPASLDVPSLLIAPPSGIDGVSVTGEIDSPAIALVESTDALLRDIDLSSVLVAKAQHIDAPAGQVLIGSEDGPLLVRGSRDGHPYLYLAFTLEDSDLPLQVAFPVLGDRLITELTGAAVPPADVRVGQSIAVPTGASVRVPGGATVSDATSSLLPIRSGFYVVTQPGRADRVVAVNADPVEADVAPEPTLPIPEPRATDQVAPTRGERSILGFVIAAVLAVLLLEFVAGRRHVGVRRSQYRAALAVRVAIVTCLLGALVGLALPRPGSSVATVFLIDGSDSMGETGRADAVAWVQDALAHQPDGARAGVAFFGGDARLELTVQPRAQLIQPATTIDATRTNLASALRLAAAVLPSDSRRRVVVVSDGRLTDGDARAEAERLRADGVQIDVHPIERSSGRDAAIASIDSPARAAEGEAVPLRVTIVATEPGVARLSLDRDGELLEERLVDLQAGANDIELRTTATSSGVARYRVRVELAGDQIRENDVAFRAVEVDGPPRVLVAYGSLGAADDLVAALRAGGLIVESIDAAALPSAERLAGYKSTVLVDVDVRSLSADQLAALTTATRDLGRGLVTVGGDHAYAMGGYRDSALEALLPVISDVTDAKRRSSVAEVLALDTSGSMGACHCADGNNGLATGGNRAGGGVNKTDIAKAGAARAIAALSSSDQVGVLAFNDDQKMVIPLQTVPSADEVQEHLAAIAPDGNTDLAAGLRRAANELRAAKAKLKHIILFTDGFTAPPNLTELERLAGELAAEGITVSVVGTGEGAADTLRRVAESGRGRFYAGRDLNEIPEILVQEAVLASRNFINEGEFFPTITGVAEAVRGLAQAPPLLGYIATTAKPSATTALTIGEDEDPLLASWNVGLGRATSWTSDASARWSQHWAGWDGYVPFWSAVVRETFPAAGDASIAMTAQVDGDRLQLVAESAGPLPEGTSVTARVTDPRSAVSTVRLERVATNRFAAEVPARLAGTYAAAITMDGPAGTRAQSAALATQSYAAEYRPGATDAAALAAVSELSGGRGEIEASAAFDAAGLPSGRGRIPLAGWLLLIAALLWPIDVALRRLTLRPQVARSMAHGLNRLSVPRRWRPSQDAEAPAPRAEEERNPEPPPPVPPPSLARLLDRKRAGSASDDDPR